MNTHHEQPKLKVQFYFFSSFYSFNILTKEDFPKFKKSLKNIQFHIIYTIYEYRFQYHTNIVMLETQLEGMM